jgi:NHL repeat-containing protein
MPEATPVAKLSLSFAKLVATPTETAWSQAYNAGNVFVCISLTTSELTEETSLQALGKDLFNVLQSEFFTLQEKNTESIKTAIQTSFANVPEHITVGLTLAFFKDATLFVFIAGSGKVVMKRGEKIGVLLSRNGTEDGDITAASGFVQHTDTIILETGHFATSVPYDVIKQALELDLPNDIVEALSPQMHKEDNGAQAAIVISYRGATFAPSIEDTESEEELGTIAPVTHYPEPIDEYQPTLAPEDEPETYESPIEGASRKPFSLPSMPKMHIRFHFNFNHRRRLFLNVAIILAVILVISIFFTVKKYNDDKQRTLFQSIYPPAQQYYSEGKGLSTVNAGLSQDSYHKADTLLKNGQTKFNKGSTYYMQITDLLTQVDGALQNNTAGQSTNATTIQPDANSLLADEQSMGSGLAFGQDDTNVYAITQTAITKISKSDGTKSDIVKNNGYWSSPVAIVPYDGNIYVLDQQKGLLKFVPGGGGYGKSTYFKTGGPDLTSATGMAIDGSVWLLFKDGSIQQYTSGTSNNLQVTGLLKSLNNPTRIVTDITLGNIYVLDSGNNRIAKFDKTGRYQTSYTSSILASAKDFTVDETNKKMDILSGGKVWQMSL